jgi:hypothetical protein
VCGLGGGSAQSPRREGVDSVVAVPQRGQVNA